MQVKYRGNVKSELSSSLYCLLPETAESQFVKELTEMLSEVRMGGWMGGGVGGWCSDVLLFVAANQR